MSPLKFLTEGEVRFSGRFAGVMSEREAAGARVSARMSVRAFLIAPGGMRLWVGSNWTFAALRVEEMNSSEAVGQVAALSKLLHEQTPWTMASDSCAS
jgi:hypothetical protein